MGPNMEEVTKEWRRLHKEQLNEPYASPNIIRVIKSKIMRWAGKIARMGDRRGAYWASVGKPEGQETTWKAQTQMEG